MNETAKELIARYNPMKQSDNINNDDVSVILNIKQPENMVSQLYEDKNIHHKKMHVFAEIDKISIQDKVQVTVEKRAITNNNKKVHKTSRRSNRLQVNGKKECLKKISNNSSKIIKQKIMKKPNKALSSMVSDEMSISLSKQFKAEETYEKSTLPGFSFAFSNNVKIHENTSPRYGIIKQQEFQHYDLNNNNTPSHYPDYNGRYTTNPEISLQSNSWLMTSRSTQNSTLNNVTVEMKQNDVGQSSFINDRQSHAYAVVDYNRKQHENSYLQSSINSTYPYKIYPMRNGNYYPYNNRYSYQDICSNTSNPRSNIYTGIETFPKTNVIFPQMINNIMPSHISPVTIPNTLLNATIRPPVSSYNYQLYQPGHEFKRLFHRNLNMVNYANNSGCEMMSITKENVTSPFNNWHHINHLIAPYNSNVNIPSTSITSDISSSCSLYTNNASAHFNNHYNNDLVKINGYVDQHRQMDQCNEKRLLQTVSSFEDSIATIDTHKLESNELTTLSHENSIALNTDSNTMSDITNFLSETVAEHEKSSSSTKQESCTKKEDWISYVFDSVYKDIL